MEKDFKFVITLVITCIVLVAGSSEKGTRQVGKLVSNELSTMKHIKNKESLIVKRGTSI